jgi:hypothetical protein
MRDIHLELPAMQPQGHAQTQIDAHQDTSLTPYRSAPGSTAQSPRQSRRCS